MVAVFLWLAVCWSRSLVVIWLAAADYRLPVAGCRLPVAGSLAKRLRSAPPQPCLFRFVKYAYQSSGKL
jgi:hypothetical protein